MEEEEEESNGYVVLLISKGCHADVWCDRRVGHWGVLKQQGQL